MTWAKIKLGTLVNVVSGFAFDSVKFSTQSGFPLIRIRDILRGYTETFYLGEFDDNYRVQKGDILIGMDGEFNISKWFGTEALLNQRVCKIYSTSDLLIDKYLLHFMPAQLKKIEAKTSFVTVKHLSVKDIRGIEIPLPPVHIQQQIADELDKADILCQKDQQLIEKYDELAQSIFYEMFGDPIQNQKGWETKKIDKLVLGSKHSIKRGPFGGALKKDIFVKEGFLVYEQYHALNNDFTFGRYYITKEKYKELSAFDVKPGDIIISCSGVYLGKLAILPTGSQPGIINQALLKISLDQTVYKNEFFTTVFSQESFKQTYFPSERGVAIPNFPPMSIFKTFDFIVPPIKLQEEYLDRVRKVQTMKNLAHKGAQKSAIFFEGLTKQYFM